MTDNNTVDTTQQETTTQPEENGTGKTFTQEEVNNIVRERLARERAKAPDDADLTARENDLKAREAAFNARLEKANREVKTEEFKTILQDAGIYKNYIRILAEDSKKGDDFISSMVLDDNGQLKDRDALIQRAKEIFNDYIPIKKVVGVPIPPDDLPIYTGPEPPDTLLKRAFGLK